MLMRTRSSSTLPTLASSSRSTPPRAPLCTGEDECRAGASGQGPRLRVWARSSCPDPAAGGCGDADDGCCCCRCRSCDRGDG